MKPLFFRYRLQVKRIKLAPHYTRATSDTLFPVIDRLVIRGLRGMCKELATPDAFPTGGAFLVTLDDAIVRSLDRFRQAGQTRCIQEGAATTAAITGADELRSLRSHGPRMIARAASRAATHMIPEATQNAAVRINDAGSIQRVQ